MNKIIGFILPYAEKILISLVTKGIQKEYEIYKEYRKHKKKADDVKKEEVK